MSALADTLVAPYKGLASFEDSEVDALLFFGRERESEVIVANLLASKLTVLYGPSGVGKSSILRAGVVRRLREIAPNAEIAVLDEWTGEPALPSPVDEAFLILDQFEEYFLYHEQGSLLDELPDLLERPRVHVLIALREDALARLDAFQTRIPNVFANRLRLDHLDEAAARAAILGPLELWNASAPPAERMEIEDALVVAVLAQVAGAPNRIEAPYLQLVMERIWDVEREAGSTMLRAETLRGLGGARAIVGAHLERALASLPPHDAAIATSALRFLVTPSRTKIAHSFGDLVDYTDESPVELQAVLERLASQRILRAVAAGSDEQGRYEIFHDVLAEPVLAWRREFEARAAIERERRASAKRHRRLLGFAAAAALLAAVMIALTVYAFAQRGEAGKQRQAAVAQADLAQQQKQQAQAQAAKAEQERKRADAQKQVAVQQRSAATKAEAVAQANAQEAKRSRAAADAERLVAQQQAARAHQAAEAATSSARVAKEQTLAARVAARRAAAGEDVARSAADIAIDPVAGIRKAVAAAALERTPRVEDALRSSLLARRVDGILRGGGGALNAAVFSPDGSLVATASDGGWVRLFRTATNEPVHSIDLGSRVLEVAFSPDGSTVLAATSGKRAVLLDVASGKVIESLPTGAAVFDATFAAGGTLMLTGGADGALRIWDRGGNLLRTIPGSRSIRTLAVDRDGSLVAVVATGDPVARVYRLPAGDLVASLAEQAEVTDAAFSPSGSLLVTTGRRNGYVWNTSDWSLRHLLVGHDAAITDVAFAADGRVVTSSVDSSARVWNPDTGEAIFTLAASHQQKVLAVAVSPDGTQIATASADETIRLWKDPLGSIPTILAGHRDGVNAVSYSPNGRYVLSASADGTARLWDPLVPALATLGAQAGAVSTVSYSPDGTLVLSAGDDATARIWSAGGKPLLTLHHGARVTRASFVDGGRNVLSASEDGTARLWRTSDGAVVATFDDRSPVRAAVATSTIVITAGDDGVVHGWSRSGQALWSATHGSPVTAAAVREDVLATGAADGSIRLWNASDGSLRRTLHGHTGQITALAFNADGSLLASGSADHTARIWRADTGAVVHRLVGHAFGVTSVAFDPADGLLLTGSVDGDARLWSTKTGRTVHRLRFHVSTVSEAAFSPDGRWVVTAGPTTAGIWQVRTGVLLYYLGGVTGQLLSAGFAQDSQRVVVGTSTGAVGTFRCTLCAQTPALLAQARYTLHRLAPPNGAG